MVLAEVMLTGTCNTVTVKLGSVKYYNAPVQFTVGHGFRLILLPRVLFVSRHPLGLASRCILGSSSVFTSSVSTVWW